MVRVGAMPCRYLWHLWQNGAVLNGQAINGDRSGPKLRARDRHVLMHLIRGRRNKAIAEQLSESGSTVKTHGNRMYEKLEVRTRVDLITLAVERG